MQADFNEEDRERLERLLSHPESAEYLTEALSKAIVSDNKETPQPSVQVQVKEPAQNDTAINVTRHFMISGGLLAGVLLLAAAVATPLRDTFTVCFNPNPVPNTSKCLGVKSYSIDQDHIEKLVSHPALVVVPDKRGNPALAVGLALFGTAFAGGSGFIAKQALKEKTEAIPVNRTNRRTTWTATKMEADKVVKQRHQDLQHGFVVSDNTNQHALAASDTLNEFSQIQKLIAALEPQERELFFQHLALKEQKEMMQQQAQIQAQQQQSPFAALLGGVSGQQALPDSTPVNNIEQAKEMGQSIIKSMAGSIKSKVLVAPSRAGKTTVLYLYYNAMLDRYPNAEVFVVADKREMIHPRIPVSNYAFCDGTSFKGVGLEMLNKVYGIYQERAKLPESERDALAQSHPVRLALIDWLATWSTVKKDEPTADKVNSQLIGLITKGASCGVCIDIDTHSATVEALGIDASTRESLDFVAIAYCQQSDKGDLDRISDGLGLLPKVISKALIVPDKGDRTRLGTDFTKLRDALLKGEFNSSIIFTTTGGNRIGITPHFERKTLGDLTLDAEEEVEEEETIEVDEDEVTIESCLLDASRAIKLYLESREDKSASFKQIRDQRSLKKLWNRPTDLARIAIDFLISQEILEHVQEVDPVLGTKVDVPEDRRVYRLMA
ncbi:hypothetical protein [Brasilonema bromeliae]|uniref:Uncharacterized protein n=1 Tax=Brasilonema bromeliae SPC951 TaxID=385972 RepID=A0ABX1PB93_9CYAN|nr:hypothetical protein [Brasilonema bromeliae]NMG20702.1 hypothetical protein [Brasilonema bromeliae SPC951]